jgi:nucleoside-diphosphate-sugar epimerase
MHTTRRAFLRSAAAASLAPLAADALPAVTPDRRSADKSLKLLILGGTGFLGPAIVEEALARGHEVTIFHRGRTNETIFPELEHIHGNRDPKIEPGLEPLKGRKWDAVLDTSSYVPRLAKASAELLAPSVDHYVMISSISVYPKLDQKNLVETDELGTIEDETMEQITGESYGPLKVLCEKAVEAAMPGRTTSLRAGLIVGPRDPSGRFTYWPLRVRDGGEVLAPGKIDDPVQWVDARDLAAFALLCIEHKSAGAFNVAGPRHSADIAELLYGCKAVSGGDAHFNWVDAEFLAEEGLQPWGHLPVWAPGAGDLAGINTANCDKAIAAGFVTRPLADTVRDTLAWWDELPAERREKARVPLPREREAEVLAKWHKR